LSSRHSFILNNFLLPLTLLLLTSTVAAQNDKDTRTLELGKPVERDLSGGQAHSYRIELTTGQYIQVVVDQRGIDVAVTLFGPDGKQLMVVDSPNGTQGPEPVFAIAGTSGSYRLEVRSPEKDVPPGSYEVKIEQLRGAEEKDKSRITAERASMEAELLRAQATAESLQNAIKKYEEALPLYRTVGERSREAMTLNTIGLVYNSLGERKKALDRYAQV